MGCLKKKNCMQKNTCKYLGLKTCISSLRHHSNCRPLQGTYWRNGLTRGSDDLLISTIKALPSFVYADLQKKSASRQQKMEP